MFANPNTSGSPVAGVAAPEPAVVPEEAAVVVAPPEAAVVADEAAVVAVAAAVVAVVESDFLSLPHAAATSTSASDSVSGLSHLLFTFVPLHWLVL
jgi:hypothetical protein